jgi:spectinomycin phosphotransferase
MLDPANLEEATIAKTLENHYGILGAEIAFLPLGYDSASWVYGVQSDDKQRYFLKARAAESFNPASLAIPNYLKEQGLSHILAPLQAIDHTLWVSVGDFVFSLYPFIEGQNAAGTGLSEQGWHAFGVLIKQIHACQLPADLLQLLPRESFIPIRRHLIQDLENAAARVTHNNPEEREISEFWHAQKNIIRTIVDKSDALANQLRRAPAPQLILCHADMHTWNVLLDTENQFWLIDWDEVILALKERDLMFAVGGIGGDGVGAKQTSWFLQGYGDHTINPTALAYYRCAWAVQDIAGFGGLVFFAPERSQESRHAAMEGFMTLFNPGEIVDLALRSTDGL